MKRIIICFFIFMNILLLADIQNPFVEVVEKARDGVVNIKVEGYKDISSNKISPFDDDFFKYFFGENIPQSKKVTSIGSGFIYKKDGNDTYIITNYHVVEVGKNGKILVSLADKEIYEAEIIGLDSKTDLAIIKISVEKNEEITILNLGDSDNLKVGQWAIAIGNPFGNIGLDRTVTLGVISATGRSDLVFGEETPVYQDYIQTDAAINPGNSGGPLLDAKGEVIGVNAAITSPSGVNIGIGFAIPINLAKKVANDLLSKGKVVRAYLGIYSQEITKDLKNNLDLDFNNGVIITKVEKNSPAEIAGLKNGDIIVKINDKEVENIAKFKILIANSPINKTSKITIFRDKKFKELQVRLVELAKNTDTYYNILGIEIVELNSNFAKNLPIITEYGVVISKIDPSSPFKEAGLDTGDIILEINKNTIRNGSDFQKVIDSLLKKTKSENINLLVYVVTKDGRYGYTIVKLSL